MKHRNRPAPYRAAGGSPYQCMIVRLDGADVRRRLPYYRGLVRKGVAGFIIFGGELETVRAHIALLQKEADIPLIIAADLERGLGQQLRGGTDFPPAMALAMAARQWRGERRSGRGAVSGDGLAAVRRSFRAVAAEARYAGMNAIFAPVLDINTNPDNPIIAARAFGEEPAVVSLLGTEMITTFQRNGIAACGKHFPGHGDTAVDSHIRLPVLKQDLNRLRRCELRPFRAAVDAGVRMIMLGHLSVPALDPSGMPVSLSAKAVRFLRVEMGYDGILVTDAMNMGGIGSYSEADASVRALEAGIDIILHPSDPDRVAAELARKGAAIDPGRLLRFRKGLKRESAAAKPLFYRHRALSRSLADAAVSVTGRCRCTGSPLVVILNDEAEEKGGDFVRALKEQYPVNRVVRLMRGHRLPTVRKRPEECLILAVFSDTRAWKGGASSWLRRQILRRRTDADILISFGSPYLLKGLESVPLIRAYGDASEVQNAAVQALARSCPGLFRP